MIEPQTAFKRMVVFPGFLEKIDQKEFESQFAGKTQEYWAFCGDVEKRGVLEHFVGEEGVDTTLIEALFVFWWALNVGDPNGQRGFDLWVALYVLGRFWIVPTPPKGAGAQSHRGRRSVLARLRKVNRLLVDLRKDVSDDDGISKYIQDEMTSGVGTLMSVQGGIATLVDFNKTAFHRERDAFETLFQSLGGTKPAYALMRTLFKELPKCGIHLQDHAKNWQARVSKGRGGTPIRLSPPQDMGEVEAQIDEMERWGFFEKTSQE